VEVSERGGALQTLSGTDPGSRMRAGGCGR
jgi:hypothetical protein